MRFLVCEQPEQVRLAQALRYEVYCKEKGWVDPGACPEGLEADEHDLEAVHFLALDDEGAAAGTARLLLGSRQTLPAACHLELNKLGLDIRRVVEVSRLAARASRRSQDLRVFLGLTMSIWQWSMPRHIEAWLAIADLPLFNLLLRLEMPVLTVGREVKYMGSPCIPAAFDMPLSGPALERRGACEGAFPFHPCREEFRRRRAPRWPDGPNVKPSPAGADEQ
jgi:N-acyl-L-homoserine lactone synthetase